MHTNKGFSLGEVLIGLLLMTTGLLATAHTVAKGIEANYRTRQEAAVMAYAQQRIELLQTVPYTHADLTAGTHGDTPAPGFLRTWAVTVAGSEKTVQLTVTRAIPGQTAPVRVVLNLVRTP
jgi:Tfp pilus assembly protein PilV